MNSPQRILVVKIADIGDLILTTPAIAALRETYPQARIDVLTRPHAAPILEGTGLADEVIPFRVSAYERLKDLLKPPVLREGWRLVKRLRGGRYDTVVLFHQYSTRFGALKNASIVFSTGARRRCGLDNGRGWFLTDRAVDSGFGVKHQVDYWLDVVALVGARTSQPRLHVGISAADHAWAQTHLPDGPRYIAIHPGSGGLNVARRWNAKKFAQTADRLGQAANTRIVIVGGRNDGAEDVIRQMRSAPINLAGQTTLNQLAAVFARCVEYIGADSGVMHLAAAANPDLKMTTLFGPTNHRAWGAYGAQSTLVRSGALCSPCGYVWHSVGLRTGCTARTCMKSIHVEAVLSPTTAVELPEPESPALRVLGVPLHALRFTDMLDHIGRWIVEGGPARMICTANPELVMIAQRDIHFFTILQRAQLVTADGIGLLWAAKRLGHPLPERVTGSDGLPIIAERAAREGWKLFLLGAGPGVAEKTAAVLSSRFPGLQVVGTGGGSPSDEEEDDWVTRVNAAHADILFLAYGSPAQEKWIARNLPRLQVGVVIGVGGAFDFVAGVTQRAPKWMRRAGIEWLHRLIKQPWRWRRMLRLPRFVIAVLRRGQRGPTDVVGRA